MATTTISTATSYATDAAFRTANQAISTAIQAVGIKPTFTTMLRLPMPPLIRQVLVTFPPIYKTRSGRQRPLKGQLWPRTR